MPRSTNTTSQRDRAAMTEKILDAAEHLLRRDVDGTGIPPLTLGDVAKEVGKTLPAALRNITPALKQLTKANTPRAIARTRRLRHITPAPTVRTRLCLPTSTV